MYGIHFIIVIQKLHLCLRGFVQNVAYEHILLQLFWYSTVAL